MNFLFVNKDAKSIFLSNDKDNVSTSLAVRRHVQMAGTKTKRRQLTHTSTTRLVGWQHKLPDKTLQQRTLGRIQHHPSQDQQEPQRCHKCSSGVLPRPDKCARCLALALQPPIGNPVDPFDSSTTNKRAAVHDSCEGRIINTCLGASIQRLSSARVDPFASFPAKLNVVAADALRYCASKPRVSSLTLTYQSLSSVCSLRRSCFYRSRWRKRPTDQFILFGSTPPSSP